MHPTQSHGGLQNVSSKIQRVLTLAGVIATSGVFALGGYLAFRAHQLEEQRETELLSRLRSQTLDLAQSLEAPLLRSLSRMGRVTVLPQGGVKSEWNQTQGALPTSVQAAVQADREAFAQTLASQIQSSASRGLTNTSYFTRLTPQGEEVIHAQPPVFTWIDFSGTGESLKQRLLPGTRAFVVTASGRVVAHSENQFVGSDFSHTAAFQRQIQAALQGSMPRSGMSGAGEFESIDRIATHTAYSRFPSVPVAVVIERPLALLPAQPLLPKQWKRWAGSAVIAAGGLLLLFAFAGFAARIKARRQSREEAIEAEPASTHVPAVPPPFPQAALEAFQRAQQEKAELERGPERPESAEPTAAAQPKMGAPVFETYQEGARLAQRFEVECRQFKEVKQGAFRMVEMASKMCESPVLYFTYLPAHRSAHLQAVAGFREDQTPGAMAFDLPPTALREILDGVRPGKMVSLAHYPPATQMIMNAFGVAHFEAWAVTHPDRLMGVLIVLQSGVQSALQRGSLVRMMRSLTHLSTRTTGMHREHQRTFSQNPG